MKKNLYLIAFIAIAMFFGACSNDEKNETTGSNGILTAVIQDNSLKTALNPTGVDVTWSEGDQFAVRQGSSNYKFTLANGAGKKVGTFTPEKSFTFDKTKNFVAYYFGKDVNYTLVTGATTYYECDYSAYLKEQTQGEAILPMSYYAAANTLTEQPKIAFKHLMGVLRFNLTGEGVSDLTKIVLQSANLTWTPIVHVNISKNPEYVQKTGDNVTITYNINEGNTAKSFDIVLPPTNYTGMTVKFYNGDKIVRQYTNQGFKINAGGITKINATIDNKNVPTVDLGLSVLWATYNVGATSPEQVGDYFAWGETETKGEFDYSWSTYKYGTSASTLTKYNVTEGVLESVDDAATVNWGSGWRTPTKAEWEELLSNTNKSAETVGGKPCIKFTSIVSGYTSKSITIPCGGIYNGGSGLYSATGFYYWTSTISATGSAYREFANSNTSDPKAGNCAFYYGMPVRPVHAK